VEGVEELFGSLVVLDSLPYLIHDVHFYDRHATKGLIGVREGETCALQGFLANVDFDVLEAVKSYLMRELHLGQRDPLCALFWSPLRSWQHSCELTMAQYLQ